MQELFTSFAVKWGSSCSVRSFGFLTRTSPSHDAVMDMEIQFLLKNFTEKDPKLLMDHIRRMASGEATFFATTLSLVYDKLIEKAFTRPTPSSSSFEKLTEGQGDIIQSLPPQASSSTSIDPPPSSLQVPSPEPEHEPAPSSTTPPRAWLRCNQCGNLAGIGDLYDGDRCPECPSRGVKRGRPHMYCQLCNATQILHRADCARRACRAIFR